MELWPLLVCCATRMEMEPLLKGLEDAAPVPLPYGAGVAGTLAGRPVHACWFGLGKANTAAGLALAIRELNPAAVIQVGIGGSFAGAGPAVGAVAIATEELHLDLGVRGDDYFEDLQAMGFPLLPDDAGGTIYNRLPVSAPLAQRLARAGETGGVPVQLVPFGTAETVTGSETQARHTGRRAGVAVESMEGAAAAQVCLALGVPFAELRGISNLVGVRDKGQWRIGEALQGAHAVLHAFLQHA